MMKKSIIAYRLQLSKKQKSIVCFILGSAIGSFFGIAISTNGSLKLDHATYQNEISKEKRALAKHRALEAELTKTISSLSGVKNSRFAFANLESFSPQNATLPKKASVMLQLQEGYHLSKAELDGIVHLVSSAVDHLSPENVTVFDSRGNALRLSKTQTQD